MTHGKAIELKTQLPGPNSKKLMRERELHVAKGPFHVTPVFLARAQGAVIEDVDGNHLLDFAGGIGVVNSGHARAELVAAIQAQVENVIHAGFNVTPYESYIRLAEKLNLATPGTFAKKTFLANSGAEAVENAIKIARAFTTREAVICFDHAFHGRTYMAMSLTAKEVPYKKGFGPFNSEIYRAPFPDVYRSENGADSARVSAECFQKFEHLAVSQIGTGRIAAVIIEPVLGEGGFIPAPKEFLAKLSQFCTQHGIVLIADEIQTGFGRTGTLFACEQLDLVPDLITTAKGLGGGMPISAVTGRAEIMDAPNVGGIGGTFGGNPVSCAAALAVFKTFEDGKQLAHAKNLGRALHTRLMSWKERFPAIGDVRGLGPMLAMEFVKKGTSKEPDADYAKKLLHLAYERGVIMMTAGTYGNVVRFLMPLVITDEQLTEGLDVIEKCLTEIDGN